MILFKIGPFSVYTFGLVLAGAVLLSFVLMMLRAPKDNLRKDTVSRFAFFAVLFGLICSRLAYCLININWVMEHGLSFVFNWSRGGFALYGTILGCLLAAWITSRLSGQPITRILDAAAVPAILLLVFIRLVEPLIGLGYGRNITDWFDPWMEQSMISMEDPSALFFFPFAVQDHYGEWNFNIAIWEALAAFIVLFLCRGIKNRKNGSRFLFGILCISALQIMFESMRQDAIMRWGFVRADQLLSAVSVALVTVACYRFIPAGVRKARQLTLALFTVILCCGIAMAMEFALEQKISFLVGLRMDACYLIMFTACIVMILAPLNLWKKAFPEITEA